jgi:hypothetical protein
MFRRIEPGQPDYALMIGGFEDGDRDGWYAGTIIDLKPL